MVKAKQMVAPDRSAPCCLLDQPADKQKSTASFPLDRLKRLKIEQIQPDVTLLPSFVPGLICSIILEQPATHLTSNLLAHRFVSPHHRPPPLFIQYQSFLI